jgi:simple sugar transport system substrate-binding protein
MRKQKKVLLVLLSVSMAFLLLMGTSNAAKKYKIVLVAKQEGIAWFDDMRTGVNEFNSNFTNEVEAKQIAPEAGDPAKQNQMTEDLIAQGVDAICVVPNDPSAMKPVLKKAKEKGIVVISHEGALLADSADYVNYDLEAFNNEDFGVLYAKTLAKAMGGKGKFAAEVGDLTMQTHMIWYNSTIKYLKAHYPKMQVVTAQPFEEQNDDSRSRNNALQILKAYPDLKGFIGYSASAPANFAAVLKDKGKKKIACVGLGMPSMDATYLKEGWMQQSQLWRPADAGYVACYIALKILKGEKIQTGTDFKKFGYTKVIVNNRIITGNAPLILTKDNVDKYKF